jgi:hypothetical protein
MAASPGPNGWCDRTPRTLATRSPQRPAAPRSPCGRCPPMRGPPRRSPPPRRRRQAAEAAAAATTTTVTTTSGGGSISGDIRRIAFAGTVGSPRWRRMHGRAPTGTPNQAAGAPDRPRVAGRSLVPTFKTATSATAARNNAAQLQRRVSSATSLRRLSRRGALPDVLVSDRDTRFTSASWTNLQWSCTPRWAPRSSSDPGPSPP